MLPGLKLFPSCRDWNLSLMKLQVIALVTSTNADHEVSTIIFFIITKKKKPNIKKSTVLAGQQLHQLRQRCKEISEKFNTYENSSNCQDIHCKCDDTAGKPYRTKLILFTGLLSCTLRIKKNWEFVHRYNQEQNCWKTLKKKLPFLLQIAASHRSVRHNTDLPPPFHSKLLLQVLSMVLYC